jgi:hypothetical protein
MIIRLISCHRLSRGWSIRCEAFRGDRVRTGRRTRHASSLRRFLPSSLFPYSSVTHPSDALLTSLMYLCSVPRVAL